MIKLIESSSRKSNPVFVPNVKLLCNLHYNNLSRFSFPVQFFISIEGSDRINFPPVYRIHYACGLSIYVYHLQILAKYILRPGSSIVSRVTWLGHAICSIFTLQNWNQNEKQTGTGRVYLEGVLILIVNIVVTWLRRWAECKPRGTRSHFMRQFKISFFQKKTVQGRWLKMLLRAGIGEPIKNGNGYRLGN